MSGRRVVVTGIGLASPLGHDLATVTRALRGNQHGIVAMPEWASVPGLARGWPPSRATSNTTN